MALHKVRVQGNQEGSPVPLNTLIDVVFLLLVYFVITWSAPTPEAHLTVNLPSGGEGPAGESLQLEVQSERLIVEGTPHSMQQIRPRLAELANMQADVPVIVKISPKVKTDRVVEVLDMCKGVGFATVNVLPLKQ